MQFPAPLGYEPKGRDEILLIAPSSKLLSLFTRHPTNVLYFPNSEENRLSFSADNLGQIQPESEVPDIRRVQGGSINISERYIEKL
jgi:hypothetical protein